MLKISLVDFGLGNLRSIQHKLEKRGVDVEIASNPTEVKKSKALIFPGVGHFAAGMCNLRSIGLLDVLNQKVLVEKTPILGICLGMQLFSKYSEEGGVEGLGWINAKTVRFREDKAGGSIKIPHVGWNEIRTTKTNFLFDGVRAKQKFYFTHSYHLEAENDEEVVATACHGYEFVCAVQRGNIAGVQFHPEKSHIEGIEVILNFIRNCERIG